GPRGPRARGAGLRRQHARAPGDPARRRRGLRALPACLHLLGALGSRAHRRDARRRPEPLLVRPLPRGDRRARLMDATESWQGWARERAAARGGPRDCLGTARLIDAAARRRAALCVQSGRTLSLARPLRPHASARGDGRPGFAVEPYYVDGPIGLGGDHLELDCHGHCNTHLDGLNHSAVDRTWYAGWAVDDADGPSVADPARVGLVTGGVSAERRRLPGTRWGGAERPVEGDEIDRALAAAGVRFEPGDALLLHMGRDRWEAAGHVYTDLRGPALVPGAGRSAGEWIADHGVSILCWDFLDANHPSQPLAPIHLLIWGIGLLLVDNCALSVAADALREAGRATGALVVAPLAVPGGTGCTVNPLLLL